MAYNQKLAERVRRALGAMPAISEVKMFGGLCFLHHGNMMCGVDKDGLMLRVGKQASAALLARQHCRPMDFTGRPMAGMVIVDAQGVRTTALVKKWLGPAIEFVHTLPAKPDKAKGRKS